MKKLERNSPAEEKAQKAAIAGDPDTFATARQGRPPAPTAKPNLTPNP